jgi:hypothetical protein
MGRHPARGVPHLRKVRSWFFLCSCDLNSNIVGIAISASSADAISARAAERRGSATCPAGSRWGRLGLPRHWRPIQRRSLRNMASSIRPGNKGLSPRLVRFPGRTGRAARADTPPYYFLKRWEFSRIVRYRPNARKRSQQPVVIALIPLAMAPANTLRDAVIES